MKTETGMQFPTYFTTGHACPGCEQCAHLPGLPHPSVAQLAAQLQDYDEKWTPEEQRQFAVFLQRFPNESSAGIISLGSAWKHGKASAAQAQPVAGDELEALLSHINDFREMNPSNYTHDEACDLNNWGVEAVGLAQAVAAPLAATQLAAASESVDLRPKLEEAINDKVRAAEDLMTPVLAFRARQKWDDACVELTRTLDLVFAANKPAAPAAPAVQPTPERIEQLAREHAAWISKGPVFGVHFYSESLANFVNAIKPVAAPVAAAVPEVSAAARDVLAERQRQVSAEGWTPEHDDKYFANELARAAACYAVCSETKWSSHVPQMWPFNRSWWKPTTERRNLVKAGALILAEIERLDRAASPTKEG